MSDLELYSEMTFEDIKHVNEYGQEYWSARELGLVLDYASWQNFSAAIQRAMQACESSGNQVFDHFNDAIKMVNIGSDTAREIPDYKLSRYACYLIVMNGDPRKEVIALGQTYFAVKTRQQELVENYDSLEEDQKRLAIRREMAEHNKSLAEAASMAGVHEGVEHA
ncbi:MAG: DNA damage-inducible protein D, partial [Oscillospiraceae bacterium]|nr:DNA damage-inducible protein D [Oscillospiraceae bacterium]